MSDVNPQSLGLLSKLVIAAGILLIAAGIIWHGVTEATFERLWHNLVDRPSARMSFRFILQPAMVAIFAIRDGLKDARAGRSAYFWTVLRNPAKRTERLGEALNATARIILLGLAMDVIYQLTELKMFYPVEALIVALLCAFVPYLLIRGPVARIARRWRGDVSAGEIR